MSTNNTPSPNTPSKMNKKKIWLAIAIVIACVVVGLVIWKMIAVHV